MSEVRSVFLAITKEDKEVFAPIYRELIKKHPDILVYNSGPVCEEIKDRTVVVTTDRDRDKDLIKDFDCGAVCIGSATDINLAICSIATEGKKGALRKGA